MVASAPAVGRESSDLCRRYVKDMYDKRKSLTQ